MAQQYALPNWTYTNAKLFPGYWLGGYDPGIRLDKIGRLWKFRLSEIDGWVEADGAAEPDKDEAVGKP